MLEYTPRLLPTKASLALTACLLSINSQVFAASFFDQFKDPEDGWFDGSDWVLNNAVGFMPVPIIITEPAVGEGLGMRYMMAQKLGMHAGIDVAQGPEDTYWYIQMGSAW